MTVRELRRIYLSARDWDRIIAALRFAADHSRDFCTRENNMLLARDIEAKLSPEVSRLKSRERVRRWRERRRLERNQCHDPEANNLQYGVKHPMEVQPK